MVHKVAVCCWENDADDAIVEECHAEELKFVHFSYLGPCETFLLSFFVRDCVIGLAMAN